jgi:predicted Zn-dependent peptidase
VTARRLALLALAAAVLLPCAARAQEKNWPFEPAPRALKSRPVAFPPFERRTLPNGLHVVVVPHHEQPAISIRLLIGSGAAQDPGDKPGLANLVSALIDQGTTTRSARQVAEAVDAMGADMQFGAGTDLTFGFITVLADSFVAGLDLLSAVVRTPAFAADELERQRAQMRSALTVSAQDPDFVATAAFRRLVYGPHPYGSTGAGTPESLDRITRDDLVTFHQRHYVPNNCILAIVGNVEPAVAFAAAESAFGTWLPRDVQMTLMLPPPPPSRRVVVIDKPDAVQTEIRVGQLGVRRDSSDFLDAELAIRILGGEGANRLQQVLRAQRGLTYAASADLDAMRLLGHIMAGTDTRTEATGEVLRVITDEFFRFQREPVVGRELEDAKAYLAGNFPLTIETPDAISTRILTAIFFNLPLSDLGSEPERVNAVTPEDIERVTRAYLRPDRLAIVLVGNASGFLPQLPKIGIRNVDDIIPIAELDLASPTLRRSPVARIVQRFPPTVALTSPGPAVATTSPGPAGADWAAVTPIVLKAVEAAGGLQALQRVATIKAESQTVMSTPAGPLKAATTTYVEFPGKMRVDATLAEGVVTQAIAEGAAWFRDANGPRDAPEGIRSEMALGLRRDWIALLRAAAAGQVKGKRLPDDTGLAGRPVHAVELWSEILPPVRLSIDAESGRILSLSYEARGPRGSERMTESFSDFRMVGELQVPFRSVVRRGDQLLFERTITDYQVNAPIAASLFQKPL